MLRVTEPSLLLGTVRPHSSPPDGDRVVGSSLIRLPFDSGSTVQDDSSASQLEFLRFLERYPIKPPSATCEPLMRNGLTLLKQYVDSSDVAADKICRSLLTGLKRDATRITPDKLENHDHAPRLEMALQELAAVVGTREVHLLSDDECKHGLFARNNSSLPILIWHDREKALLSGIADWVGGSGSERLVAILNATSSFDPTGTFTLDRSARLTQHSPARDDSITSTHNRIVAALSGKELARRVKNATSEMEVRDGVRDHLDSGLNMLAGTGQP